MPVGSHALRPGWLSRLLCVLGSEPSAWMIGSALLMDCEQRGGWAPPPACCAAGARVSAHHLGPLA
eukprot:3107934-Prymnesium_polylepis.1